MKYQTLFFSKLRKMSQNLSSAAVVIGVLRVNVSNFDKVEDACFRVCNIYLLFFLFVNQNICCGFSMRRFFGAPKTYAKNYG